MRWYSWIHEETWGFVSAPGCMTQLHLCLNTKTVTCAVQHNAKSFFSCKDSRTSIELRGWNKGVSGLCQPVFSCVMYSFSTFINFAKASKKNLIDYQGKQPSESAAHFPPAGKPVFVLQGNALPRRLRNHYRRQLNICASLQLWALPKGESMRAESPMILAITRAWIRRAISSIW